MAQQARDFALADDYDTALHIVESIRRKALAQHNQQLAGRDSDDDDGDDDVDEADDDDSLSDNNNNDDDDDAADVGSKRELRRRPESHADSPQPPAARPKSHRALDALRIEPLVELHRIASGRNLRLKHVSQVSKGPLSPHALTPRAPSGRRPTERPSSWSSSSTSSLARQVEAARVDFRRPQTHRSNSVGGSSPLVAVATSPPAAAPVRAMPTHERRTVRSPFEPPLVHPRGFRAPAAQDRRSSFTISELALKEMGFARTSPPGPETAPIPEDKQFVAVDAFARLRAPLNAAAGAAQTREPTGQEEQGEGEEEGKAVYQFALWKKAGRSRQLPDAISTRCAQAQQEDASAEAGATPWRRQQQQEEPSRRRSPSATFAALRVDAFSPEAFSPEGDRCKSESPALHLTRSRSPTISASRSFRRAAESLAPEAAQ